MADPVPEGGLMWTPNEDRAANTNLTAFMSWLAEREHHFAGYGDLWQWSVTDLDGFWQAIWDYCGVEASAPPQQVLGRREMPGADRFPARGWTAKWSPAAGSRLRARAGPMRCPLRVYFIC